MSLLFSANCAAPIDVSLVNRKFCKGTRNWHKLPEYHDQNFTTLREYMEADWAYRSIYQQHRSMKSRKILACKQALTGFPRDSRGYGCTHRRARPQARKILEGGTTFRVVYMLAFFTGRQENYKLIFPPVVSHHIQTDLTREDFQQFYASVSWSTILSKISRE